MRPVSMKNTEKYGRGIFATRNISKGEFVEEAPVIVIPKTEWKLMRGSILLNYIFRWGEDKALALGYGSLYNHSYSPNARFIINIENKSVDFYAIEDIKKGEEIRVNYHGDPNDQSPLWFQVIE